MQDTENEVEGEKEQSGKREKPVVRPEEIPPVPENRFLLRRDMPSQENKTEMSVLSIFICLFVFLDYISSNPLSVYNYMITKGVSFRNFFFSELSKKKRFFRLSRNQPSQSLDGRSEAEEQWFVYLNSDQILVRSGVY